MVHKLTLAIKLSQFKLEVCPQALRNTILLENSLSALSIYDIIFYLHDRSNQFNKQCKHWKKTYLTNEPYL
jgi:hypothetical protein